MAVCRPSISTDSANAIRGAVSGGYGFLTRSVADPAEPPAPGVPGPPGLPLVPHWGAGPGLGQSLLEEKTPLVTPWSPGAPA